MVISDWVKMVYQIRWKYHQRFSCMLTVTIWWISWLKFWVKSSSFSGFRQILRLSEESVMMKASPTLSYESPTRNPFSNLPSKKLPSLSSSRPLPVLQPWLNSPLQRVFCSRSIPKPDFSPLVKLPSKVSLHSFRSGSQWRMAPFPWSIPLCHSPSIFRSMGWGEEGQDMVQRQPLPWQVSVPQAPSQIDSTLFLLMDSVMPQSPCRMVSTLSPKQSQRPSLKCRWASSLHLRQKQWTKGWCWKQGSYFRNMLCLISISRNIVYSPPIPYCTYSVR